MKRRQKEGQSIAEKTASKRAQPYQTDDLLLESDPRANRNDLVNAILDEELAKQRWEDGLEEESQSEWDTPEQEWNEETPDQMDPEMDESEQWDQSDYPTFEPEDDRPVKKRGARRGVIITAISVAAVILLLAASYGVLYLMDSHTILPNLTIVGVNVGGMDRAQAEAAIGAVADAYRQKSLFITFPDSELELTPEDSNVKLDVQGAVDEAYRYGRYLGITIPGLSKSPQEITPLDLTHYFSIDKDYIRSLLNEKAQTVYSELTQPEIKTRNEVQTVEEETEDEEGNPVTKTVKKNIQIMTITLGTAQRSMDVDATLEQILQAYSTANFEPLTVEYAETLPEQVDAQTLYSEYCTEAVDAYYDPETYSVVPEVPGFGFDLEKVKQQLAQAKEGDVLEVILQDIPPKVTEENLSGTLFQDTLASYDSPHTAIPSRTKNLELACAAINGTIVNAGETFSFNKTVGERTAAKGYQPAAIYANSTTVNEVGGGVCQVASTIYMCTLLADLEIVERTCHQFTVTYVPMGMDATVYWGYKDFQWKNNTDYPIRVNASVSGGYVHVSLTGTETKDYTINMTYEILSTTSPGTVKKEITDGSHSNGEQLQAPHTGYHVRSYKHKIDKNGNEISVEVEDDSNYTKTDRVIAVVNKPTSSKEKPPVEDPNAGGTTDPSAGGTTDPNTGGTTDPNGGGTTDPNGGGTTDPNAGGTTDPNAGGTTDPNAGGATDPNASGATDPNAGGATDPNAGTTPAE